MNSGCWNEECWPPDYFRGFGIFLVQRKVRAKVPFSVTVVTGFALLGNYYQRLGFFAGDLVFLVFVFPVVPPY